MGAISSQQAFYGSDKSQPHKKKKHRSKICKTILNISAGISDVKGGESFAFIKINLNSKSGKERKGREGICQRTCEK